MTAGAKDSPTQADLAHMLIIRWRAFGDTHLGVDSLILRDGAFSFDLCTPKFHESEPDELPSYWLIRLNLNVHSSRMVTPPCVLCRPLSASSPKTNGRESWLQ
jgi:hypothetical protein